MDNLNEAEIKAALMLRKEGVSFQAIGCFIMNCRLIQSFYNQSDAVYNETVAKSVVGFIHLMKGLEHYLGRSR